MNNIFSLVSQLKQSAKTSKDFQDYNDALNDLMEAIKILSSELNKVALLSPEPQFEEDYPRKLAREIADCYGIAGGIYRRLGNLDKSLKMYHEGYKYEQDKLYDIQDSYNLSNLIVVPILQDAANLRKSEQKQKLKEALTTVQKQVQGKRRDQWWAWADLGLFYLLNEQEEAAIEAYQKFSQTGARVQNYESTLSVLDELKKVFDEAQDPFFSSIEKIIKFLNEEKSKIQ